MPIALLALLASCSTADTSDDTGSATPQSPGREETGGSETPPMDSGPSVDDLADVTRVRTSGVAQEYTFSVTIRSPDTGCDRYADWWEVLTIDGELLYRRILAHSHVGEQPFTRSGGPVVIGEADRVVVRAHMNDTGYGGVAFAGSVADGFAADSSVNGQLAAGLAEVEPLPDQCAF